MKSELDSDLQQQAHEDGEAVVADNAVFNAVLAQALHDHENVLEKLKEM